ncbi:MAG: maleylpyruvate isomerase N-terminal domain-containing protein [Chloroflexi bacterium]|nr:maleylpyruvate isomerase N-terminal domain-containing protein [Chloroflexota bacterium]
MEDAHIARNEAARALLCALAARLSASDLEQPLGHGWTVAAALAHLAFWDRRVLALLEEVEQGAHPAAVGFDAADFDAVNDAELEKWVAMPPQEAVREALAAAEAVDRKIADFSPGLVATILTTGRPRLIDRSIHRQEHFAEIEQAIGRLEVDR